MNTKDTHNLEPILRIENLTVEFGSGTKIFRAVDRVNLEIGEREILGLVGESGSGKTTIGKTAIGLTQYEAGKVTVDNRILPRNPDMVTGNFNKWLARTVQMIFQDPAGSLHPSKKIFNVLREPLLSQRPSYINTKSYALDRQVRASRNKSEYAVRYLPHEKATEFLRNQYVVQMNALFSNLPPELSNRFKPALIKMDPQSRYFVDVNSLEADLARVRENALAGYIYFESLSNITPASPELFNALIKELVKKIKKEEREETSKLLSTLRIEQHNINLKIKRLDSEAIAQLKTIKEQKDKTKLMPASIDTKQYSKNFSALIDQRKANKEQRWKQIADVFPTYAKKVESLKQLKPGQSHPLMVNFYFEKIANFLEEWIENIFFLNRMIARSATESTPKDDQKFAQHIAQIDRSLQGKVNFHGQMQYRAFINEEIMRSLAFVDLGKDSAWKYSSQLSGGQQQRVGIARALSLKPKLIVADEPISALDVSIQAGIVNKIKELRDKEGLSILFIAHDLRMVKHISDRIAVIYRGKIVEIGAAEEVYNNPQHPYTKSLISAIPTIDVVGKSLRASADPQEWAVSDEKQLQWFSVSPTHRILATQEQTQRWQVNSISVENSVYSGGAN